MGRVQFILLSVKLITEQNGGKGRGSLKSAPASLGLSLGLDELNWALSQLQNGQGTF